MGIPMCELDEIIMTLDEFEASRLADLDGLYQELAAERMGVSRPTFSRIIDAARRKVADALVHGKALRIEGGPVHMGPSRCCQLHDAESDEAPLPTDPGSETKKPDPRKGTAMNLCIPVTEDLGLKSPVCAHFGSAPIFMIVDTESESRRAISNSNQHHGHGMCTPLASLQGEHIDGMAVGGIGMGALTKLQASGIRVFMSEHATVAATVAAFKAGTLRPMTPGSACAHHAHGSH
jgi:predicted DNA-binding protein (UPF0251 family)/predicted Fe-Mo cluster-binding NifX family protein